MTEKRAYENILVELNTIKAPSLHLEDYNYWSNKGMQEYTNERYNVFATSQQLTDDLQALNSSVRGVVNFIGGNPATYSVTYTGGHNGNGAALLGNKFGSGFTQTALPANYMHLLSLTVDMQVESSSVSCDASGIASASVKRLTQDVAGGIMNNAFLKPSYRNVYYQITDDYLTGVRAGALQIYNGSPLKSTILGFTLDYIKQPTTINLTAAQRDFPLDNSAVLEWPEYVCNELVKRVVKLILENQQNPRLQSNIPINQTIK